MKQPDACIVRITDAQGKTKGTGFLVSTDGLITTCIHVVEGTEPCVAFPGGGPRPAQVIATDQVHDVAILRIEGELPHEAEPVRLGHSTHAYDRGFRSRGYRPLGGLEGIPAKGEVLNAVSEVPGYPDVHQMPLVLQTQHVRGGMSGAPVYVPDLDLVVGMVTSYWDSLKAGTGFADRDTALASPAEAIAALCPDIRLWEPRPELTRPPTGIPFQVPVLPRYFVPRPEVSNDLKTRLLAEETTAPGTLVVSAVHGLGGIGKTTLVAALAHNPDLQARFPDGILWATLGHRPDVLSLLVGWVQALRDYDFRPTVVESASNHLRTLLHDKACLLVVDDAWQTDHLRPFLVGGERCRVLVTTRDAALARKVGAHLYDLDVMTESQALALFEARLGPLDGRRDQAAALAHELGYLPLALELAAAQVEAGISWAELLDVFRRELADMAALDLDEATYRNESLRFSFRLSLERLSPDDREAFAWLGVLPEDARLNPAMAATLWDQPEVDSRKRLRRLRDKALLKRMGDDQYTVHDLLHDEAKLRLAEQMSLPDAHAALLVRYRACTQNGLWHTLPDDGYIHEHLTRHMEQAGQPEAIHTLLREETAEGRNGWYQARERLGQTAGYLEDVARAWRLAEEEFTTHRSLLAMGLQCRYAFITASLNSLAKNIPPALLVALVEKDAWAPAQGLAYARQMPDLAQRAEALTRLAPYLSGSLRGTVLREALTAAREIGDEEYRAEALAQLAFCLTELNYTREALTTVLEISRANCQAEALAGLAPNLPESMLREALAAAREMRSADDQAKALARLVPRLAELGYFQEAVEEARAIQRVSSKVEALARLASHLPEAEQEGVLREALLAARSAAVWDRRGGSPKAEALAALAPHLPRRLLREALAVARETGFVRVRAEALSALAPRVPEAEQEDVFEEALLAVQKIKAAGVRARVLAGLAPNLPEPVLREALVAARDIEDEEYQAEALTSLAPRLAELDYPREALAVAREIKDEGGQAKALTTLAPHLPEPLLRLALAMTRRTEDTTQWLKAVASLAPYLPEPLLRDALTATRRIGDRGRRANTMAVLAPCLAQLGCPREALAAAQEVEDEDGRAQALASLAPHLLEPLLWDALAAARELPNLYWRDWTDKSPQSEALAALVPRLAKLGYPREALAVAREIEAEGHRAKALLGLAHYLSEPMLNEALAVVRDMPGEDWEGRSIRAQVLAALASRLAQLGHLQDAFAVLQETEDEGNWAKVLTALVPYLPEHLLQGVVTAVRRIQSEKIRAEALAELAPHLPEHLVRDALAAAQEIGWEEHRVEALTGVAPHLPEPLKVEVLKEALKAVRHMFTHARATALTGLAPYLPEQLLEEAVAVALAMRAASRRVEALTALAPYLSGPLKGRALREALVAVKAMRSPSSKLRALTRLAPHLSEVLKGEVLQEALALVHNIGNERVRAEALVGLAPHFPEPLLRKALAMTRNIEDRKQRAIMLTAAASRLAELGYPYEALGMVLEIEGEDDRVEALAMLASHLAQLPGETLVPVWQKTLPTWATHTREDLLVDLRALVPAIATLGGTEAVVETFHAIQDVGRWWP
jgi:hypothetical protein